MSPNLKKTTSKKYSTSCEVQAKDQKKNLNPKFMKTLN